MNEFFRKLLFLPEQASTFAADVDRLHIFVALTTIIMSVAVGLTALFFFARYRRKTESDTTPHLEPSTLIEVAFVSIPLALFLLWFAIGYRQFVEQDTPPADAMDVYVMGKKWMWKFNYPEGPNSVNVLRVPAGRPVRLLMTSQDVIHSFYVPEFRVKRDLNPGRYTQAWFTATTPGRYQILCAEYCGAGHSIMRGEVVVMKPEEYEAWLTDLKRGPLATRQDGLNVQIEQVGASSSLREQGKRIAAEAGCMKCHTINGERHIGPSWLDMWGSKRKLKSGETITVDEGYMTESIMDPQAKIVEGFDAVMPSFQNKLTGPEIAALVEYMKSLQSDAVRTAAAEGPVYAPVSGR
jgi:cytochrome c oxidase subunit II